MRKIIDFHTHPFIDSAHNIKRYKDEADYALDIIREDEERAGISMICGSVLHVCEESLDTMLESNADAFAYYEKNPDFYIPGIQVNPNYIEESCKEIDRAASHGLYLIGEINPKRMAYERYDDSRLLEILAYAAERGMTVSCHSMTDEEMDNLAAALPQLSIVNAHPGELARLDAHIERMQKYENVHLDLSGTGLFRYGMLRYILDKVGKEKVLFGTDYPVCNPAMYVEGVLYEKLSAAEEDAVFYDNAARLLKIGE